MCYEPNNNNNNNIKVHPQMYVRQWTDLVPDTLNTWFLFGCEYHSYLATVITRYIEEMYPYDCFTVSQ